MQFDALTLYTPDLAGQLHFYREVLGLAVVEQAVGLCQALLEEVYREDPAGIVLEVMPFRE
ncbi:MAG: VOC family protein [Lewinella sp.]|nr:VOC family protein [Lewinella sp.]